MKHRHPELLLMFYILLPVKSPVIGQILLCQIRSIHTARQAEKKLVNINLTNNKNDEALTEFMRAIWLDTNNALAYAYLGWLAPHRVTWLSNPVAEIIHKLARNKFEFSTFALNQSIIHQIRLNEIHEAINNGKIIKDCHQERYNSSYVICGFTQAQRPIHVKCSDPTRPLIKIIVVYEPDPDRWSDNFTMRRNLSNDE